jgi:Tol biopolymer transport system component
MERIHMPVELRRSYPLIYLVVLLLMSACKVEETIDLRADGSGTYRAKISVTKDFGEAIDQVKREAGQHGLRVLEEGQTADEKFVVVGRDFSKMSDLGDKDDTYSLVVTREGWFRKSYRFEAILRKNIAASGFQRILHVRMPGSIDSSSSGQLSSHSVEWPCSQGGQLDVVASGFAIPELSSLPAFLSATVDRALSQSTLVFVKDGALWVAAQDGSGARPVGPKGIGSVSTAATGAITYDRFNPGGGNGTEAQDLNVYLLDRPDGKPRKLTDDNQSILPKISADGRSVVYQKFAWNGSSAMNGQGGRGLWLYDVATGHERELVGADERANSGAPFGLRKWRLDEVIWGADGQSLILTRQYQTDGGGLYEVNYLVNITDGHTEPFDKYKPDGSYRAPRLALDAGHVLAVSWHGSENGLIEEDVATRQARIIVPGVMAGFVVLSPDGNTIAYTTSAAPKGSDLWTVRRDGSEFRKLTERPLVDGLFRPEWAPDGRSMVGTVWSASGSLAGRKIVRIDSQSGQQEILASGARSGSLLRKPRFPPGWMWLIKNALLLAAVMMGAALLLWLRRCGRWIRSRRVQRVAPALVDSPRHCRACGQALPAAGTFCVKCGTKLD